MTRQEQIEKAATAKSRGETPYFFDAFIAGAKWADRHPDISMVSALAYEAGRNDAINEACEWLEQNAYHYCDDIDTLHESALIGDFRHTMKGGQL